MKNPNTAPLYECSARGISVDAGSMVNMLAAKAKELRESPVEKNNPEFDLEEQLCHIHLACRAVAEMAFNDTLPVDKLSYTDLRDAVFGQLNDLPSEYRDAVAAKIAALCAFSLVECVADSTDSHDQLVQLEHVYRRSLNLPSQQRRRPTVVVN